MALASAQDTRERICLRAKAARERLRHEIGRCFSPHDVAWAEEHLSDLGSLEQAQIAVVEDSIKEVARRRDELLAARRDRRALEKLRQRRFSEHRYLMGREEAGELDDMFGSRREVR
jgi:flagellar export protein FliJ